MVVLLCGGCFEDGPPGVPPEPVEDEDDAAGESSSSGGESSESSESSSEGGSSSSSGTGYVVNECAGPFECHPPTGEYPYEWVALAYCWCGCDLDGSDINYGICSEGETCTAVPVVEEFSHLADERQGFCSSEQPD